MRLIFFFNDTATTEIYTLSLHDALPIFRTGGDDHALEAVVTGHPVGLLDHPLRVRQRVERRRDQQQVGGRVEELARSEEHTSELQSRQYLVCRLLLEKKKRKSKRTTVIE